MASGGMEHVQQVLQSSPISPFFSSIKQWQDYKIKHILYM